MQWTEGGGYSYKFTDAKSLVYVDVDDDFAGQEQFIIGSVEAPGDLSCPGATWNPSEDLDSGEATDRYAAVKALGLAGEASASEALRAVRDAGHEDIRIQVEAIGALGRLGDADAVERLAEIAVSDEHPEGMPMEAVFILSELTSVPAADALVTIAANPHLDEEVRAAAVWGLGATGHDEPARLLQFIGDPNDYVAVHAVVAAGSNLDKSTCERAGELLADETRDAAAAARLLANQSSNGAQVLADVSHAGSGSARVWALRGLGLAGREAVATVDLPADTIRLLEPMLAAEESFIDDNEVLKLLLFVEKQVTFNPLV